ncbi:MAG: hypothetical protein R2761_06205 [Acidimicrobiales bacterium]
MTPTARARLALSGLVVALSACGSIPEPASFQPTTSTRAEPASAAASPGDQAAAAGVQALPAAIDPAAAAGFEPLLPDGYIAQALVATDQGVLAGDIAALLALPPPLATFRAARVVDDLVGGVVAQAADAAPDARGDIVWLPADRGQPTLIDGTGSTLFDAGFADGTPWAVVAYPSGEVVRIRLVDLTDSPLLTLDHDEQLLALSAAGAVHAIAVSDAACGQIRFHGPDGALIDLPAPALPTCEVPRRPTFGAVALSSDGRQLAYTMITYRDDGIEAATEVLVRDLTTGTDLVRRTVGREGEQITSLGYDNMRVLYLRQARDGGTATPELMELTGEGRTAALPLPPAAAVSSVSFARRSLTADGP